MKNQNMVRDSKENTRFVIVYSNDEVKIRRFALMYDEYICKGDLHPETVRREEDWYGKKPKYQWYVTMRMAPYKRKEMMKNCDLVGFGSRPSRFVTFKEELKR